MSIGVVLFDLENRYFSQLSNYISLEAHSRGYLSYIAVTEKEIDSEAQILDNLASRRVDGIILVPITQGKTYTDHLKELEIPVVTIGNRLSGIPHVSINDYVAACESTRYIAALGYRRIVFVCPPLRKKREAEDTLNISCPESRAQGFASFFKTNANLRHDLLIQKDYRETAVSIVRAGGEKTAFFCSSDVYALELMKYFKEKGISIPRDAGVMGFDNLDILNYISPRLTTVSASQELVGKEAVNTLLKMIGGETVPNTLYLPHEICPGETL
jgi:DNA-binding LacI/PurR family transcriptional regulator